MMHAFGYFSDRPSSREQRHFLRTLDRYRSALSEVSALPALVRLWIERFEEPCLATQVFCDPCPEDLVALSDSGNGREL